MKKAIAMLIMIALTLSLVACGDSGTSSAGSTPASSPTASPESTPAPNSPEKEEAYEITYSSARAYTNSIGTTYAQVIVEIENTGSADLYLSSGSYDLEDANGSLVTSSSMVSTYPNVIAPGEKAYMYEENMLDEAFDGELSVLPRPDVDAAKVENIRYATSDVEITTDQFGYLKAKGRVENTSEEASDGMVYVVLILKNADGNPIGQMFTIVTEEIPAGGKIGFEMSALSLPDDVTEDAIASYDIFAYPMQMQF